ncbi:MAG: alpha-galactosidase [Acidobacteriaceae bacterium]|nr:alpha-galactosidase [Acidobacteriaceae bacterium]
MLSKLRRIRAVLLSAVLIPGVFCASAQEAKRNQWVAAKFDGQPQSLPNRPYLVAQLKSGTVERKSRHGHALSIAGHRYSQGIHCPSTGKVTIHLPGAASRFQAVVGVDSNDIEYYSNAGRGAVSLSINANGGEVFRTPAMHEEMPGVPIDLNLSGSSEFTINITGDAQQSEWNQVDLADAKVFLKDESSIFLDEMPIGPLPAAFTTDPPFSFRYGGQDSHELLPSWNPKRSSRQLDSERTEHVVSYSDPNTGLVVRCIGVEYHDSPTIEWTVYFKNAGNADSPLLEDIQSLDTNFERNNEGEFLLHHNRGAPATPGDYEPFETKLDRKATRRFAGAGGRPTNHELPYFNLAWPGEGIIIVIGWPGQWAASFARDGDKAIHVRAGQELTHLKLLPGEEIRIPLVVLQFWTGDWIAAQNGWRRWMLAHNMPHPGAPPPPQLAANSSREYIEMKEANEQNQKSFIDRYLAENIKLDYWWMDAGWYVNNGSWVNTGTWEVDRTRFPKSLRAVNDYAHAKGIRTIVWFEPERVTKGTWLYEHHPEWLLTPPSEHGDQLYDKEWRLLDFGNPEARAWITERVDHMITQEGIDTYRQDFNMDPLYFWRAHDSADRQGITEIRYVTGLLAYWDELRRRHPGLLIDTCASGGRRVDIETLRRAVPLTRSDYLLESEEPISQQMQTYGMAMWIPYYGTGVSGLDPYLFRSQMCPAIILVWDLRRTDLPYDEMRKMLSQWRSVADDYFGDFYPLTPYSMSKDVWAAWQFDNRKRAEGFLQVFRRSASAYESAHFKLRGLDLAARYLVSNVDTEEQRECSGRELMDEGVRVELRSAPGSALLRYKVVRPVPQVSHN